MKKINILLLAAVAAFMPLAASAQAPATEILIAAGSSSGTYQKFLGEISSVTSGIIQFKEVESHGSVENLDHLVNNKVSAAFMHADVPYFRANKDERMKNFKTLLALFTEEVHFLAPATTKRPPLVTTSGGNIFGLGKQTTTIAAKEPVFIDDLKGLRVGASGGGAITAQVINIQANIGYEFVEFASGTEVLKALDAGQIDAAVFVGGAPLPNLEKLGKTYKLLPIGNSINALKQVYKPATVTYPGMSTASIATIGVDCVLLAREYKSAKMIDVLKTFRRTFNEKLLELQETPGVHPKWSEVVSDSKGTFPYLELGE